MINKFLFHLAVALDLASVALLIPFLDFFITSVGLEKKDLGWVQSIYGTCQAIGLPLAGIFAERLGRRPLMLLSMFGTPTSYIICLISMKFVSLPLFIFSRFFIGLARHTMTVGSAMLLDEAGENEGMRAKALSGFSAAASAGFIFAPTIGGKIMDLYGVETLCSCSVVCGFTAGILMTIATRNFKESSSKNGREMISRSRSVSTSSRAGSRSSTDVAAVVSTTSDSTTSKIILALRKVLIEGGWESRLLVLGMFANSVSYVSIQTHTAVYLRNKFAFTGFQVGLTISLSSFLNAACQFFSINSIIKTPSSSSKTKSTSFINISPRTFLLFATWSASLLGVCVLATSTSIFWYYFGLVVLSLCSGTVDSMAKATLSTYFGNANALAMSLVYCMDGANRMMVPLTNSWVMSSSSIFGLTGEASLSAPLYISASAALLCSTCHTFSSTAKRMGDNNHNKVVEIPKAKGNKKTAGKAKIKKD